MKLIKTIIKVTTIDEYQGNLRIFTDPYNYKDLKRELYIPVRVFQLDGGFNSIDVPLVLDAQNSPGHAIAAAAGNPAEIAMSISCMNDANGKYLLVSTADLTLVDANTLIANHSLYVEVYVVAVEVVAILDTLYSNLSSQNGINVNAVVPAPLPVIVFNDYAHPMIIRDDHYGENVVPVDAEIDGLEIIYPYQFTV